MKIKEKLVYLGDRPKLNLIILVCYYLLVVLPHEEVGAVIGSIFNVLPINQYNGIVLIVSLMLLIPISAVIVFRITKMKERSGIIFYASMTLVLMILAFNYLFTLNIEFVHFVQYGFFVLICFPLSKSYITTYIWASLAGLFDELYQYLVLTAFQTDYFDINDVIINMIGAGGGLVILKSLEVSNLKVSWRKYLNSIQFYVLSFLLVLTVVFSSLGYISKSPGTRSVLVLFKTPHSEFWTKVNPDIILHLIKPVEGVILVICLVFFYSFIEKS